MSAVVLLLVAWHVVTWENDCARRDILGHSVSFDYDDDGTADETFMIPCEPVRDPATGDVLWWFCPRRIATPLDHEDGTMQRDHQSARVMICPIFRDGATAGHCAVVLNHRGGPVMEIIND